MGTTVADSIGDDDNKIAFIFACPGRREEKHKKVCSGATGTNLDKLLVKLNEKYPKYFVSTNRYDYTIINSCDTVYPNPENPDKTEPDLFEIDEDDNLKRIYEEVKDKECIICFGNCADYAANSVMKKYPDLKFEKIKSDHLSPSNLNRNYESEKDTPDARNRDRIEKASETIFLYFKKKQKVKKLLLKKHQIWNKEKHWFTFKFSIIFLLIAIIFFVLFILSMTIWNHNIILCLIFSLLTLIFLAIFLAPILKHIVLF